MASDVTKMTRLVKIVSLLRQNVYPNHKTVEKALRSLDVAGVYNVSQKTIQRDVQYLRDMYAAPIAFDNGRRGYYLTDPEWKFEVPNLEADEMRAVETSRLFYNGWLAADKSLEVNVIAEIQENKQQTQGQVITQLFLSDPAYASYRYSQKTCMYMYRNIKELGSDLQNKDYQAVASTFASIDMFSRASTLLIKHSVELGMYKDENGNIHYRNSAFLHYLIRTARLHALRNIAECKRLQIPCVAPIKLFEKAEIAREKKQLRQTARCLESILGSRIPSQSTGVELPEKSNILLSG